MAKSSRGKAELPIATPIHLIYGADGFLKRQRLELILRELGNPEDGGIGSVSKVEGDSARLSEVLDELRTFSLLGGKRVVIVEDADDFISDNRERLENYCKNPADTGVLVLLCKSSNSATRVHKAIDALGGCFKCEPKKGADLESWIASHAMSAYGKRLGFDATKTMTELCDPSLAILDTELCKLATFVGGRAEITSEDIEALVGRNKPESIFQVSDAMASGDTAGALTRWDQTLATDRSAAARAVGGLAWGFRRLLEARHLLDSGMSLGSVAGQMRMPPQVLQRVAQRFSIDDLEDQLCALLQADLNAKTGLGEIESGIEQLLVRFSRPRTSR